jgi:tetratricopeptide (TPR) repeat protein
MLVFTNFESKGAMTHVSSILFSILRLTLLIGLFSTAVAQADDYGDVSQLIRSEKYSEALAKADAHLASKPRDPQMRFLKGVIQRVTGKQADAIVTFTKLTEEYPELPEPYNNLAVIYAAQSQFDKARAALEMAIRTNPSYATAHENLGDVYARLASQAYNSALQIEGANATAIPKLALIREVFKPNIKGAANAASPSVPSLATVPVPAPVTLPAVAVAEVAAAVPVPAAKPAPVVPVKPALSDKQAKDVEAAVLAWAKAWSNKDMPAYLGAYGKEFSPPGKLTRSAWEQERRKRILGKTNITLKLENLSATVTGNKAVAKFRQDYRANALSVSSRKTLELVKVGDQWLIVKESTGN